MQNSCVAASRPGYIGIDFYLIPLWVHELSCQFWLSNILAELCKRDGINNIIVLYSSYRIYSYMYTLSLDKNIDLKDAEIYDNIYE